MNLTRIIFVLVFFVIGWVGYAMTGVSQENADIKGQFETVEETVAYDEVDEKEMELYVSPFVRELINHPGSMPPILDIQTSKYSFQKGEYPIKLKDLIGILVEGHDLKPHDVKLKSELTGDHWNWHHFGGKETSSGVYYSLDKIYPYYSDPFGNYYADEMGFDTGECYPTIVETVMGKGKVKNVTFFTHESKSSIIVPELKLVS